MNVVLQCGLFGEAVACKLADAGWTLATADIGNLKQVINEADQIIFASWRDNEDVAESIDRLCAARRVPWTSVVQEPPHIRIGPGILYGSTPCYGCFSARRKQHDRYRVLTSMVQARYANDEGTGVRGFLPHHATLSVGLATATLDQVSGGQSQHCPVFRYHTLRHQISDAHVVGVHGCQQCGYGSDTRSVLAISKRLNAPGRS
jgi:bacteriocin biosynthesis cyclodehydratase domain-containing protein